ncbi:hypothetical protein HQO90_17510 [Rhodococcus fascians]|nr:hypothetical protein [Rhodococcus fascians]
MKFRRLGSGGVSEHSLVLGQKPRRPKPGRASESAGPARYAGPSRPPPANRQPTRTTTSVDDD